MEPNGYGTAPTGQSGGNDQLEQMKNQVDQVKGIMANNINKVIERGDQLDDLQNRADDMQNGAVKFRSNASRVRRKMWWKNVKMWIVIVAVVLIIIAIIAIVIASKTGGSGHKTKTTTTTAPPTRRKREVNMIRMLLP
ncbi:hypothetical protein SNEBB_009243 [Seison nebaliae]|nr:hypothetical protein SNEBB_009243 [Seison nebaliae]